MNRFDICEAFYLYAMLYHGGQWSKEYAIFGRLHRIGFRPAPSLSGPEDLEEGALAIFERLVAGESKVRS